MKRRLISFGDSADKYLETESDRLGISIPELVRRIVDRYREEMKPAKPETEIRDEEASS